MASVPGPDGKDIWEIAIVGQSPPRLIRRAGRWPAISPDGLSIAFQGESRYRGEELWVAGISGESSRKLLAAEDGESALSPVWSPDGRWIAYLRGRQPDPESGQFARTAAIEVRPASGGPARTLVRGANLPASASLFCMKGRGCLTWSPDGRLIFTASDPSGTQLTHHEYGIWAVPVDLRNAGAAGEPLRLAHWPDYYPNCLTLTADGKRLAFLKGRLQMDVYLGELGSAGSSLSPPRRWTLDNRGFGSAPDAWTRDSRAMLLSSDRNGKLEVFRQGLNETLAQRIVEVPGDQPHDAQLSPDGSWILYVDRVSPQRLMRLPAAGGSPQLVLELPASVRFDYKCPLAAGACVMSRDRGSETLFYQLDPVRGKADRLLGKIERQSDKMFSWDVSPDGSRLAVVNDRNKILTLADGTWHEIPVDPRWSGLQTIAWAADGRGFFATSATFYLLHVTTAGKASVVLHNDRTQWLSGPVPSPDGKYLAYQAQTFDFNAWMIENP
jgi:Tol biopolymer transport system component